MPKGSNPEFNQRSGRRSNPLESLGEVVSNIQEGLPGLSECKGLTDDDRALLADVAKCCELMAGLLQAAQRANSIETLLTHVLSATHPPELEINYAREIVRSYNGPCRPMLKGIIAAWRAKGSDRGVNIHEISSALENRGGIDNSCLGRYCSQTFARDGLIQADFTFPRSDLVKYWKPNAVLLQLEKEGSLDD
jgi:hypothetical protein